MERTISADPLTLQYGIKQLHLNIDVFLTKAFVNSKDNQSYRDDSGDSCRAEKMIYLTASNYLIRALTLSQPGRTWRLLANCAIRYRGLGLGFLAVNLSLLLALV